MAFSLYTKKINKNINEQKYFISEFKIINIYMRKYDKDYSDQAA